MAVSQTSMSPDLHAHKILFLIPVFITKVLATLLESPHLQYIRFLQIY